MKKTVLALLLFLIYITAALAQSDSIIWYSGGRQVAYRICEHHSPVVEKALNMFSDDMIAVTGHQAEVGDNAKLEIFQLDKITRREEKELARRSIDYSDIINKKDAFIILTNKGKVVVLGSNGRGTAYGILEMSRIAGVSPWIFWGDVVPEHKNVLSLHKDFYSCQSPSVEYRGIFINDEDWSSRLWARTIAGPDEKPGDMGPIFYKRIFELLLRLRANTLWPAMHEGTTAFFLTKGNRQLADTFDIVIGTSHCEPMLRNNVGEWDQNIWGDFNFITNKHNVCNYWKKRLHEVDNMEAIYTLGMRGIHDGSMQGVKTKEEKIAGLQSVIDEQRSMLKQTFGNELSRIPQVFVPYKEVLEIYENGLEVPEDVILMWCDDNYGYLTRLSDTEQQKRVGGAGIYYHLSYWGRPHDYLWLTTTQPGLIFNEMSTAYNHNARRVWIANIHDPKVAAYDLSLFMDMAWSIDSVKNNTIGSHLNAWLTQQFGRQVADILYPAMRQFYHLCGIRRPEFLGWTQVELDKKKYYRGLSPVQDTEFATDQFGNELQHYLNDYKRIKQTVLEAETLLRPELSDAFFAVVKYPVFCAAAMAAKTLNAQVARQIYNSDIIDLTNEAIKAAMLSRKAYQEILDLTHYYNNIMSGGKWKGIMNCKPRNLPVFESPTLPEGLNTDMTTSTSESLLTGNFENEENFLCLNACQWNAASDDVKPIDMLGHSMNAVSLPRGSRLSYDFYAMKSDSCIFRFATIPTQANDKGDIRYCISIDGENPVVFNQKEPFRSERWKQNVLRGQAVRTHKAYITKGRHNITIKALDDHIIVDQWMMDYDINRRFYVFPVR